MKKALALYVILCVAALAQLPKPGGGSGGSAGGGTPGGSDGDLQKNNAGAFGAATAGTDYVASLTGGTGSTISGSNGALTDAADFAVVASYETCAGACVSACSSGRLGIDTTNHVQYFCDAGTWRKVLIPSAVPRGFSVTLDGGGSAITTGLKTEFQIPYACTITSWTILLDQSGSIVFDLWKDTLANYPPLVGDTITASAKPTVSSATNATSSTLTGWTTSIAAGDTIKVNVDSITTATRATLIVNCSI